MFDLTSSDNVAGSDIGQLNPVGQQIISNPVDNLVATGAACLNILILRVLSRLIKTALSNPVVLLGSIDFTGEADS